MTVKELYAELGALVMGGHGDLDVADNMGWIIKEAKVYTNEYEDRETGETATDSEVVLCH